MKVKFLLFGLCALALASCSIDEVSRTNDSNAISFKATTATRATVVTTNNINAFSVWGWKTDGDGEVTETMIDGDTATKGSTGTYNTERTYYWPGCAMDFCAFIPAATEIKDGAVQLGSGTAFTNDILEDGTAYDYTGYVATATVTSPDEMSVKMHVPADPEEEIDLCYAVTKGRSTGTVPLNFRHALSQIAFKAMNGNADWTVDIQEVTLCGIYKEGTYTLPVFEAGEEGTTGQNSDTAKKGTWTVDENAPKGRFNAGVNATTLEGLTAEAKNITGSSLMLVPQTVPEWNALTDPTNKAVGAYVRIKCQVIDEEEGQIWPNYKKTDESTGEPLEYAEITVPFDVKWDEGYKYTYTIVFGEGLGYYPPDDGNPDLEGTPVLIPIRFTVDIDDFDKTGGGDVSTEPAYIDYFDYIIDENFLAYMQKFDINKDGHLYYDELEYITEIKCGDYEDDADSNYHATDFTGIEYYYNLTSFTSNTVECTSQSFEKENEEGLLDLSNNTKLSYIYIPKTNVVKVDLRHTSLVKVPDYAFKTCAVLTTVYLPDCLETIGEQGFCYCYALESIELPNSLTSIEYAGFYGSGLKSIVLPESVNEMGTHVFAYCYSLASAKLPSTLEKINTHTFYNCYPLDSIEFPNTLKEIGNYAFYYTGLQSIKIPDSVETIGNYVFYHCHYLTEVELSSSITTIGTALFDDCTNLTYIKIPEGVTTISGSAFSESGLVRISLPSTLTSMSGNVFYKCYDLTSIEIPEGVGSIGGSIFYGCSSLETVKLPSTITSIGDSAFYNCTALKEMTLGAETPPTLGTSPFYGFSSNNAVLYVPSESIDKYKAISTWTSYFKGGIKAIEN